MDRVKTGLKDLGAAWVVSHSELERGGPEVERLKAALEGVPGARLGVLCISGPTVSPMAAQLLAPNATIVACANARGKLFRIRNSILLNKDLVCRGFSLSRWVKQATGHQKHRMVSTLTKYFARGQLRMPVLGQILVLKGDDQTVSRQAREAMRRSLQSLGETLFIRFERQHLAAT